MGTLWQKLISSYVNAFSIITIETHDFVNFY